MENFLTEVSSGLKNEKFYKMSIVMVNRERTTNGHFQVVTGKDRNF